MVLATSASGAELGALRRAIGADDAIAGTASAEDVREGKPAPEPVEHALELAGVPASRAVFVGDTVWDMRAGSKAGVRCVGLLCGGIPRADLAEAGAEAVYADPADLLARLAGESAGLSRTGGDAGHLGGWNTRGWLPVEQAVGADGTVSPGLTSCPQGRSFG